MVPNAFPIPFDDQLFVFDAEPRRFGGKIENSMHGIAFAAGGVHPAANESPLVFGQRSLESKTKQTLLTKGKETGLSGKKRAVAVTATAQHARLAVFNRTCWFYDAG